jgi:hypothetical protein
MTPTFSKTDLARLVALPRGARVLAVLGALRFVAATDLRLIDVAAEETDALVESDLVFRLRLQRRLTEKDATDVLALRRQGALELARVLDVEPGSVPYSTKTTCERSAMFLDHQLALARFALLLARDLHEGAPAKLLSWEQEPDRLADAVHLLHDPKHLGRQPLVADGLAVVHGPHGPEGLLVEIDRGTERSGYMARKYAGYLAWWKEGGPERKFSVKALRLRTVAPDAKRRDRLREACREATEKRGSGLFWFAAEDDLVREGILAAIWSTLRGEKIKPWS